MLPAHLSKDSAQGLIRGEPVAQYEIGGFKNFVYLILDWQSKAAAIIDPQKGLEPVRGDLRKNGFTLTAVFLTHTHWDHIAGVPELLSSDPRLPVFVHPQDVHRLGEKLRTTLQPVQNGQSIPVGELSIGVLHTPGHSAGECSYYFEADSGETPDAHGGYLFTGDTIFIRDCGRTDFEDGSNDEMFASLQTIKRLPPSTIILPGHHYARECASTLEREMRESPPFRCQSVEELAALP